MRAYLQYWRDMLRCALRGSRLYYVWLLVLGVLIAGGALAYARQLQLGLGVTNLSDQVSWGAYIANFTFLVGIAAAAVLLVVPTYIYHRQDIKQLVIIAELMAASAMIMCLLFVTVDLGRPERFLHLLPGLGRLNFPRSMLAWDILALTGYLIVNLHVPGYLLYQLYRGRKPRRGLYLPFVYLSIFWAVSIHTVTAFLYSGFGGRPFWNTAIMAPRFLVSAFASGPALLILVCYIISRYSDTQIPKSITQFLRRVLSITLPLNYFLLFCELFKEFYTGSAHAASAHYLFFGLRGHAMLAPYIWTGLGIGIGAMLIMLVPRWYQRQPLLLLGCVMCILGVWVEKGMGLIIPGFIPSPAGDVVEYTPAPIEFLVSLGIWSLGAAIFTVFAKVALAIQSGALRAQPTTE